MSVITFKPNDHTKITTDFERSEFACPCGCTAQMIDPELVQKMQTIRTKLGKAIKVTSGYRCVKHNADPKVGGSRTSRHLYGIAADWRTRDRSVNPVALGIIAVQGPNARAKVAGAFNVATAVPTEQLDFVVLYSSLASVLSAPFTSPYAAAYAASKFALRGFSEALRREMADTGVGVLYVAPRATRTSMNSAQAVALNSALKVAMDPPESVADAVLRAIELDRSELYLGWPEKFFVRLNGLLPSEIGRAHV